MWLLMININFYYTFNLDAYLTVTGFVDLFSLYRNWLVLLLRRLVMIYYQPPDQHQTVQAQVLLNVCIYLVHVYTMFNLKSTLSNLNTSKYVHVLGLWSDAN